MKSKKLLSLLLALMMMLSVVPMYASAADPIALTASNITVFPTVTGTIYYGQTVGESLTLTGGEVQYNGEIIPGEFVHTNSSERPTGGGTVAMRASFTFNPADTENYTGFSVRYSRDVTYMVLPTTPIYVDENSKPYIENTEVEAGTKLSDITINGSAVKNPYYPEESRFLPKIWTWVNPDTIVEKSGYFDVVLKGDNKNYNNLTHSIYINVAGSVLVPTIEVSEIVLSYDKNRTGSDIKFDGTKAYVTNDDGSITEVPGTFSVPEAAKDTVVPVGEYDIPAIFTPTDTETYSTVEFTVPVKVSKGTIKFVDENGAETIPEITIPYGLKMGDDLNGYLRAYLNAPASLNFTETEYYNSVVPVGTHDLTVKTICDNTNYERYNTLPFKLTVEPVEADVEIKHTVNNDDKNTYELYVIGSVDNTVRPQGTFALYVDGQLLKDGVAYGEHVIWTPAESKNYELKAVYTPKDNDPCIVADVVSTIDAKLYRKVTTLGTSSDGEKEFRCGETIQVVANIPEFIGWVITDAAGNTVDLGVDLTAKTIEFAVPDYDITIEAKSNIAEDDGNEGDDNTGDDDTAPGLDTDGSHKFDFVNLIKNLIAQLKAFIQQIGDFFSNMSLDSLGEVIG